MVDGERDPDNPRPSGPITHWIDTNVMLEVYSHGDLYEAFEAYQRGTGTIADVEVRRVRLQGSLWMAMALCTVGARSVTYEHENVRNIRRISPPGSNRGAWTSAIVWLLGEHGVFDGWERHMTNDGAQLSNRERDKHMVAECSSDKLVLITRDERVIAEGMAASVDVATPEVFAERHITRENAARMFGERLWDAVLGYVSRGPSGSEMRRFAAGRAARDAFRAVWQSPSQPWFK